ncbi:MAG: hypothetical protein H6611_00735 [Ignavibacteriales bacterium]|nr:hypothetical protein [Ignavibacteriales bacterium]
MKLKPKGRIGAEKMLILSKDLIIIDIVMPSLKGVEENNYKTIPDYVRAMNMKLL